MAENKTKKAKKFKLQSIEALKKLAQVELLEYIKVLYGLIKKNKKELKNYKKRVNNLCKKIDDEKQKALTKPKPDTEPEEPKKGDEEISATAAFGLVDELRQAAEQAQNLSDFIYEPTSGLYYDQKTGYYYNAEYGLYYDGNTGCYYSYNQEKKSFEFHSQVQVQPSQTTASKDLNDSDIFEDYDGGEDVEFDESGGVITDREKLKKIRAEKQKAEALKKQLRKDKNKSKNEKQAVKTKRTKHSKRGDPRSENSDQSSDSDAEESAKRRRSRGEVEDGELSTSSGSSGHQTDSEDSASAKQQIFKSGGRFQDIAKKYPPSLRIIVQETDLDDLKVGSLSLITFKGGSLGRVGNHDVIIPDVNVSKSHLKFIYDTKKSIYKCTDLGSRNGTILNGTRMSDALVESEPLDMVHGSVLQIAHTKLLCHIHEGNTTCGLCEPGLLIETKAETAAGSTVVLSHKEQLKKLQKKYGLENEKFVDGKQSSGSYNDRAATRRVKVGSTNESEKTQTASVNTEISSENKGFKMLSKLGWSKGEALGKTSAVGGLLEPINVSSNAGKTGLGCGEPISVPVFTKADNRKIENRKKTLARYEKVADIFGESESD